MATVAIELSDVGLNAVTDSGPVGAPSPGYALLDRTGVITLDVILRRRLLHRCRVIGH